MTNGEQYILETFTQLASDAQIQYYALKKKDDKEPLNFESAMEYSVTNEKEKIKNRKLQFHFGAKIKAIPAKKKSRINIFKYEHVTYSLVIIDPTASKILRKFHFDYSTESKDHPIFHFQYPGELTPQLQEQGYADCSIVDMEPWLSIPRLHYFPITIALLLNLVFLEFSNETTHKIIEDDKWRAIVRENERQVLKPYYASCHAFLNTKSNGLFINDFYYGK